MSTTFRVTHTTEYAYEQPVTASYGQLHLLPRELPWQHCREAGVQVTPWPELYRERADYFGNRVSYFALHRPHRTLTVTATSVVEVDAHRTEPPLLGQRSWEAVRDTVDDGADGVPADTLQYVRASPRIPIEEAFRAYARSSFAVGRPILDAVQELCSRIHADFTYEPGSAPVQAPLVDAFAQRRGVAQDFAHVAIACLRALGLPAQYVSGYLETDPAAGRAGLAGADGSHAWLALLIPGAGWVAIDPTYDRWVSGRYIVTAIGRDYGDVPPLNGVIYTDGKTEKLDVRVDVTALS